MAPPRKPPVPKPSLPPAPPRAPPWPLVGADHDAQLERAKAALPEADQALTAFVRRMFDRVGVSASGYIRQSKLNSRDKRILNLLIECGLVVAADSAHGMAYHRRPWPGAPKAPA